MKEKILQFGEGNFLRGFADAFIDKLNKEGLFDGGVVIVKPTDSDKPDLFSKQSCVYNLILRGFQNGEEYTSRQEIRCVSRFINPYKSYNDYISLANNPELRFVISNTTEAGICFSGGDCFDDRPAHSFPAKVTQFLYARYEAGLGGLVFLPCELIDGNADRLRDCIIKYAELWELGDGFISWIKGENRFCNTLVDRIVTGYPADEAEALCREIGYDDRLLDTAEPYHLWAIEGDFESELPLKAAGLNVIWCDDIKPYKKQKVRILNGAHTLIVFPSLLSKNETVKESLDDGLINRYLQKYLGGVVLPVLDEGAEKFADSVIERFKNPFIRHQLKAISLNSVSKFNARVLPTAKDYYEKFNRSSKEIALSLAALIYYYKNYDVTDEQSAVNYIRNNEINDILSSETLWEYDLRIMSEDVRKAYKLIEDEGIRRALEWSLS